ncbi:MAG TPA: DUF2304 domain-containing protein [Candidatus Pygmaiobacter gallistercoris]|nr:DUF2304 domain-containing protein [Candidatus Pygmaiobacter gallistercoris]
MNGLLLILLFSGAVITMVYFIYKIRKNRLQIGYTIFWSLFSAFLVVLGAVPEIVGWAAGLIGVKSPANLLYLCIIFVLIIKQFTTTIKLSTMDRQITELTQYIALHQGDNKKL